eukprot:m.167281 g.167281  ORF g.167281 m.167281 type:complete len:151 (+) comp53163_c0_seq2:996-1448(+)
MDGTAQPFVPSHARSWSAPSSGGQSPLFPPFYNGYKSPDLPGSPMTAPTSPASGTPSELPDGQETRSPLIAAINTLPKKLRQQFVQLRKQRRTARMHKSQRQIHEVETIMWELLDKLKMEQACAQLAGLSTEDQPLSVFPTSPVPRAFPP